MKLHEFQQYLARKNIPCAIFVHPDPAITYFAGMKPSYAVLLIKPKSAVLYLTKLDRQPAIAGNETPFRDRQRSAAGIAVKTLTKGWLQKLKNMAGTAAGMKIGINKHSITVASLERLKKYFPRAKFADVSSKLEELREKKTPEEIQKIENACTLTSNAFTALLRELPKKALRTEQDVALFLEKEIRRQGGDIAFPTIAATGKNAAVPHHVTSTNPLRRGFLVLDFGASYQHYCADMSRTIFLGKPTTREKKLYAVLLDAQQAAIGKVSKDVAFSALENTARKRLGRHSGYFTHSLGHGIGIEVHEGSQYRDTKSSVQENHVFTIEPGIYLPGMFGMRIEDTVVFDGKPRVLTKATKELICIP